MIATRQFCTFFLDGLTFGVDVARVQEVVRYHALTRVPLSPRVVSGLMNLRGQIVVALDLRRRLGLSERAEGQQPMNVVVRDEDGAVSLLVDDIGDVIDVDPGAFEDLPETLQGGVRQLVDGVFKMPGHLMLVLNTEKTVAVDEKSRAR